MNPDGSVISKISQIVLVEAEVMPDFMQKCHADFLPHAIVSLRSIPTARERDDAEPKNTDFFRKAGRILDGPFGEGQPRVQPAQVRWVINPQLIHEFQLRLIVDDQRRVSQQTGHMLREARQHIFQQRIESGSLSVGHWRVG